MWVVEGGKYKASFLLEGAEGERLLISEVSFDFLFFSALFFGDEHGGRG